MTLWHFIAFISLLLVSFSLSQSLISLSTHPKPQTGGAVSAMTPLWHPYGMCFLGLGWTPPQPHRQLSVLGQMDQTTHQIKALCKPFELPNPDCEYTAYRGSCWRILVWCSASLCNDRTPAQELNPIPAEHTFENSLERVHGCSHDTKNSSKCLGSDWNP